MSRRFGSAAVLLLSILGWAQSKEPVRLPGSDSSAESADAAAFLPVIVPLILQPKSVVTLDQFNGSLPSQTKCDADGNVYGAFAGRTANSITRISADGHQTTTFSLGAVPDPDITSDRLPFIAEFAIATDGDVYLLVLMKSQDSGSTTQPLSAKGIDPGRFEYRIIIFDSEGKYHSQFKLEQGLAPNHVAVFPSGKLMLAGLKPAPEGQHLMPFAGVFDSRGRFIDDISMPSDLHSTGVNHGQPAWSLGSWAWRNPTREAQGADDGNVYLLPSAAGAPVYMLSPSGEIIRTIMLGSTANEPLGMSIAAGRLIYWSRNVEPRRLRHTSSDRPLDQAAAAVSGDSLVRIFNLQTGELAAAYIAPAELGNFACYSSGDFTFLRLHQPGRFQVVRASAY